MTRYNSCRNDGGACEGLQVIFKFLYELLLKEEEKYCAVWLSSSSWQKVAEFTISYFIFMSRKPHNPICTCMCFSKNINVHVIVYGDARTFTMIVIEIEQQHWMVPCGSETSKSDLSNFKLRQRMGLSLVYHLVKDIIDFSTCHTNYTV